MVYSIRAGDTVLGWSNLELADPSMGVVYGAFQPAPGYSAVRQIFRMFAEAQPETSAQPSDTAKLQRYYEARDALGLELLDARGRRVAAETIHISDCSEEAGLDALVLEVILSDPAFWESYNPCASPNNGLQGTPGCP